MFFNFYQFRFKNVQQLPGENSRKRSPLERGASWLGLVLMLISIILGIIYHSCDIPVYTINGLGWILAIVVTVLGMKRWNEMQAKGEICSWYKQYLLTGGIALFFMSLSLSIDYGLVLSPLVRSLLVDTHADPPLTPMQFIAGFIGLAPSFLDHIAIRTSTKYDPCCRQVKWCT